MGKPETLHPPATDHEIAAYKRGLRSGVMRSATPNVVASLIARIEQETDEAIETEPQARPDPGHLAGLAAAERAAREAAES